jgi:hypothetical protein
MPDATRIRQGGISETAQDFQKRGLEGRGATPAGRAYRVYCSMATPSYISSTRRIWVSRL